MLATALLTPGLVAIAVAFIAQLPFLIVTLKTVRRTERTGKATHREVSSLNGKTTAVMVQEIQDTVNPSTAGHDRQAESLARHIHNDDTTTNEVM